MLNKSAITSKGSAPIIGCTFPEQDHTGDQSPIDGLSAAHYHTLRYGSGISDDVIKARAPRTSTGRSELKSLGILINKGAHTRGLLLPLHGVDGQPAHFCNPDINPEGAIPFTVYRPDVPQFDRDGKPRKYLAPKGAGTRIDCPPMAQPSLGNPAIPLWITEGQKKADALISRGACAIALLGVWNWRGKNEDGGLTALPEWNFIALKSRDVHVVFDSDVTHKKSVKQALKHLAAFLVYKGARVKTATLPGDGDGKTGVDDFLLSHTMTDLEARLTPVSTQKQAEQPDTPAAALNLKIGKYDRPLPIAWNVSAIFEQDDRWGSGAFKYNEMSRRTEIHRLPDGFPPAEALPRPVQDSDLVQIVLWLSECYDLHASIAVVDQAIEANAQRHRYHPVRNYLNSLTWDGTPRLDTWLTRHCGVEDNVYTSAVASKTLIGAVARIMEPGCQMDTMTILCGAQGTLKSSTWRALGGDEYFGDDIPHDLAQRDAKSYLQGLWIIEFAELSQFKRSEIEAVKSFVSTREDKYRAAYGRKDVQAKRSCIFVGTTNQDVIFQDETGNRRFWPVKTHGICDIAGIIAERDQLWAEAMTRYSHGEPWYLTGEAAQVAQSEQESRTAEDPWQDTIAHFLQTTPLRRTNFRNKTTEFVTADQLLEHIGLDKPLWNTYALHRVGRTLRMLGWIPARVDNPAKGAGRLRQLRGYIPEPVEPADPNPSGSGSSPHKTWSEPVEPVESVDLNMGESKNECSTAESTKTSETNDVTRSDALLYRSCTDIGGSTGSSPATDCSVKSFAEPVALGSTGSAAQASGSSVTTNCLHTSTRVSPHGRVMCNHCERQVGQKAAQQAAKVRS
jgi:putative DNA primase/helicase